MIFAAAVAVVVPLGSCKKDKEGTYTTSESLPGTLTISVPKFIGTNSSVLLTPKGITSDTVDVGYYWTAKPLYEERDTTRHLGADESVTGAYEFISKDTLCTVTLTCYAFAKGYSTQNASAYCTIVDPALGKTVTNDGVDTDTDVFVDSRDGKNYYYKTIGTRDWFVKNLAWEGAGSSFQDCEVMDGIYGRYYTWTEALTSCPDGWRLPSDEDWLDLASAGGYAGTDGTADFIGAAGSIMADARFNGEKMWEYWPAVKITNRTGFAALPAGYCTIGDSVSYGHDFEYAVFWSSESSKSDDGENMGIYRMIYVNRPDIMRGALNTDNFGASVRCVRDSE